PCCNRFRPEAHSCARSSTQSVAVAKETWSTCRRRKAFARRPIVAPRSRAPDAPQLLAFGRYRPTAPRYARPFRWPDPEIDRKLRAGRAEFRRRRDSLSPCGYAAEFGLPLRRLSRAF